MRNDFARNSTLLLSELPEEVEPKMMPRALRQGVAYDFASLPLGTGKFSHDSEQPVVFADLLENPDRQQGVLEIFAQFDNVPFEYDAMSSSTNASPASQPCRSKNPLESEDLPK